MTTSGAPDSNSIKRLHELEFTDSQWEEIFSFGFEPFEISHLGEPMTRAQWMAVADMALGKATRIRRGYFGEDADNEKWIAELEAIAEIILEKFPPYGV